MDKERKEMEKWVEVEGAATEEKYVRKGRRKEEKREMLTMEEEINHRGEGDRDKRYFHHFIK